MDGSLSIPAPETSVFPPPNLPFDHDVRDFPLVRVRVQKFQTYDLEPHFGQMLRFFKGAPAGFVYDIRGARVPTARESELYARFLKERGALLREKCAAGALVADNPLQRVALAAIHWMFPIPFPVKAFACPHEAERWVRERLTSSQGA